MTFLNVCLFVCLHIFIQFLHVQSVDKNDETYGEKPTTSHVGRKAQVAPAATKDYDEKIVSLIITISVE